MTVLRLERRAGGQIEAALAMVEEVTLARSARGAFAETSAAKEPAFVRALAFAGIAAVPCEDRLEPSPDLYPAVGRHLAPLTAGAVSLDIVRIRRLPLADSTAEAMRRGWAGLWPPSRVARDRCRALLRGTDVAFAWTRSAWGTRAALRMRGVRDALRPVVFDRDALARGHEGRVYAREGLIERWIF